VQDLPSISEQTHREADRWDESVHPVEIDAGSKLAELLDGLAVGVNTLHHQAVDTVGRGLCAVAWALDGTIEAVECDDARPVFGVQWHPELLTSFAAHRALFEWVVREAAAVKSGSRELADGDELAVA
jgi:putative glutamine amidotransferase